MLTVLAPVVVKGEMHVREPGEHAHVLTVVYLGTVDSTSLCSCPQTNTSYNIISIYLLLSRDSLHMRLCCI